MTIVDMQKKTDIELMTLAREPDLWTKLSRMDQHGLALSLARRLEACREDFLRFAQSEGYSSIPNQLTKHTGGDD